MPFIGNQPALSYTSFAKQDFTTSATTSYTLDNPVANANELALFINFVRQEPTTAYTASGTSLTLTSATSASDDMYCVFLGKAVQTVNPPNSSVGNSQLDVSAINSQTAETSIAGGDEVLIYDTSASALKKMTRTNFVSGIGGTNTPAFRAINSSGQNLAGNGTTFTKVQLDTEQYDTASAYDNSSNYRFTVPSGQAGKYFISAQIGVSCTDDHRQVAGVVYKNGSGLGDMTARILMNGDSMNDGEQVLAIVGVLNLSVGDYLELYGRGYDTSNSGTVSFTAGNSSLQGFKIIE
jgi:hypothetical protein